jgi:hypothetical protein
MADEKDISLEKKWFYEEQAKTAVANFKRKNINAQYVSDRKEALSAVLEMIPEGATISRGDSVTLEQIGIIEKIRRGKKYKFIDPFARKEDGSYVLSTEDRFKAQREAFFADVFLTGTNAVTLDGKLVNIDALGNRVAAMIFGPQKVIVVAGANKIVKNADEALQRVREIVAPLNARRHYQKHRFDWFADLPCVKTGKCADCNHEWRICRNTVIVEGTYARVKGRINVVLVGEELGI